VYGSIPGSPANHRANRYGVTVTTIHDPAQVLDTIESSDRFLVQQIFKPIANEYRISVPTPGSTDEGRPLLFVKQKKMTIKEDIRFRLDPDAEAHLFMIKSKSVFEFRGRHDVLDEHGQAIGQLEKAFGKSLLRSHWNVRDASGALLLEAYESSLVIALVRRLAGIVSDYLSALTWLPFNFTLQRDGSEVAALTQRLRGAIAGSPGFRLVTRHCGRENANLYESFWAEWLDVAQA
jgi:hypothetical protein